MLARHDTTAGKTVVKARASWLRTATMRTTPRVLRACSRTPRAGGGAHYESKFAHGLVLAEFEFSAKAHDTFAAESLASANRLC